MHTAAAQNVSQAEAAGLSKPRPTVAMQRLIAQIRSHFPFYVEESFICQGPCEACSKKLLEYLDSQLCEWEHRLNQGECPKLGDLNALARKAKKIHRVLAKHSLIGSVDVSG